MHGLIPILTVAVENNSRGFQWFKDAEDGVKVKINTSLLQPMELHLNSVLSNQNKLLHYLYSADISAFWKKSTKLCVCIVIHFFFWSYILALPSFFSPLMLKYETLDHSQIHSQMHREVTVISCIFAPFWLEQMEMLGHCKIELPLFGTILV